MSLEKWRELGLVRAHKTSANEIRGLLDIVDRDLADSGLKQLSVDGRFNSAHNAALQAAVAALAAAGYRPETGGKHHYTAFQSLQFTIGLPARELGLLEAYRKKRNTAEYDRAGAISDADATAIRTLAQRIAREVRVWLEKAHPSLLEAKGSAR